MKNLLLCGISILFMIESFAVDPHFSLFYASPLTLNPALTGLSYGHYRVSANYRNQWAALTPFKTYSVGFDMSLLDGDDNADFAGLGLMLSNSGIESGIKNLNALFSFSYFKSLGENKNHYLSLGFQGGFSNMTSKINSLSTQSQWTQQGYDASLYNGEVASGASAIYPDFNLGLFWFTTIGESSNLFAGSSLFHLFEPELSLVQGQGRVSRKYVLHVGGKIRLTDKIHLLPNIVALNQNGIAEYNQGVSLEYSFSNATKPLVVALGLRYRNSDDLIISTMLEYQELRIEAGYDINLDNSMISEITNGKGGFELALIYNISKGSSKAIVKSIITPCPRF